MRECAGDLRVRVFGVIVLMQFIFSNEVEMLQNHENVENLENVNFLNDLKFSKILSSGNVPISVVVPELEI